MGTGWQSENRRLQDAPGGWVEVYAPGIVYMETGREVERAHLELSLGA
jgi:hypothetical protein